MFFPVSRATESFKVEFEFNKTKTEHIMNDRDNYQLGLFVLTNMNAQVSSKM